METARERDERYREHVRAYHRYVRRINELKGEIERLQRRRLTTAPSKRRIALEKKIKSYQNALYRLRDKADEEKRMIKRMDKHMFVVRSAVIINAKR